MKKIMEYMCLLVFNPLGFFLIIAGAAIVLWDFTAATAPNEFDLLLRDITLGVVSIVTGVFVIIASCYAIDHYKLGEKYPDEKVTEAQKNRPEENDSIQSLEDQ